MSSMAADRSASPSSATSSLQPPQRMDGAESSFVRLFAPSEPAVSGGVFRLFLFSTPISRCPCVQMAPFATRVRSTKCKLESARWRRFRGKRKRKTLARVMSPCFSPIACSPRERGSTRTRMGSLCHPRHCLTKRAMMMHRHRTLLLLLLILQSDQNYRVPLKNDLGKKCNVCFLTDKFIHQVNHWSRSIVARYVGGNPAGTTSFLRGKHAQSNDE